MAWRQTGTKPLPESMMTCFEDAETGLNVSIFSYICHATPVSSIYIYKADLPAMINTLRPGQNGHHFPDDIFKCIFMNENA